MKTIELFFAKLPSEIHPGRYVRSRWRMTRESIERQGGIVLEDTLELREVPETEAERVEALLHWSLPRHR